MDDTNKEQVNDTAVADAETDSVNAQSENSTEKSTAKDAKKDASKDASKNEAGSQSVSDKKNSNAEPAAAQTQNEDKDSQTKKEDANEKVLSPEEVDALLKVTQQKSSDLSELTDSENPNWLKNNFTVNKRFLNNITELTWAECEHLLSSFLKKKITVKLKNSGLGKLSDCVNEKTEKHVYSVFLIDPSKHYALSLVDLTLQHHAINMLYGGQIHKDEPIIETAGKIGVLVSEKLGELGMEGFANACKEYGEIEVQTIKSVTMPNLISKLSMDDIVYSMELSVFIGDIETTMTLILAEGFLQGFIPENKTEVSYLEKDFWKTAIEKQVVDSNVTIKVQLPDVNVKMQELMNFKAGDVIPIGDPTLVYICMNNIKIFRGAAAQSNAKRVVKIESEI